MRTNSTQKRLNITILFYVHKNMADILTVATKCIDNSDHRKQDFGAFSPLNLETALWQQNIKSNTNRFSLIIHYDLGLLSVLNFEYILGF